MTRRAIILNPNGGRGRAIHRSERVRAQLAAAGFEVEWHQTQGPGHATELARQLAERQFEVIGAMGGDGTLNEVLAGMRGTVSSLAVIPAGTGNDFARHMGLKDLKSAVQAFLHGKPQRIDVAQVNGRPFLNSVACGFDALVGERVNLGYKWARGTMAYVMAVGETLARLKAADLDLTIDGKSFSFRANLCAIANASSYGGGMKIAPMAQIADGALDVIVVEEVGRLELLRQFPKMALSGSHVSHPKVHCLRGREIRATVSSPWPYLVDGEMGGTVPLEICLEPGGVKVMRGLKENV